MRIETEYEKINWTSLLLEAQTKFDYLRLAWQASEREASPALHAKMVNDLFLPCLKLLAEFCACVDVAEGNFEDEE